MHFMSPLSSWICALQPVAGTCFACLAPSGQKPCCPSRQPKFMPEYSTSKHASNIAFQMFSRSQSVYNLGEHTISEWSRCLTLRVKCCSSPMDFLRPLFFILPLILAEACLVFCWVRYGRPFHCLGASGFFLRSRHLDLSSMCWKKMALGLRNFSLMHLGSCFYSWCWCPVTLSDHCPMLLAMLSFFCASACLGSFWCPRKMLRYVECWSLQTFPPTSKICEVHACLT